MLPIDRIYAHLLLLVATSLYGDLTQRLAMSIGTARMLDEVDLGSWIELATSVGLSERYARASTAAITERVVVTASAMDKEVRWHSDHGYAIYEGILERSATIS